jgi:hypothetical protein
LVSVKPTANGGTIEEIRVVLALEDDVVTLVNGVDEEIEVLEVSRIRAVFSRQTLEPEVLCAETTLQVEYDGNQR